jgi:two-component system, NtrC family, sensor histidine kinase HydH
LYLLKQLRILPIGITIICFVKLLNNIQTRYIIAILLFVTLLMFGSAYIELVQSRGELLHVLNEQSLSLGETIERSSANVVLATDQIERQLSERLLNNAYYIAKLDSMNLLSGQELQKIAATNNIFRINIFNAGGVKILSSLEPIHHMGISEEKMSPKEMLKPILEGTESELILGLKQARYDDGQRFAVAVRRTRSGGGVIVLNLDAAELVEFRKRIGIGKLIRDLGDNSGIEYVVLQDSQGIIAATDKIDEISSIQDDQLLGLALRQDSVFSRQIQFGGHDTFEVVKRLSIEGSTVGVLRIGLSMDELRSTENRMIRRMLIMTVVLIAIGALVFIAIVVNQNYRLISQRYAQMHSFTGSILENMRDAVITIDNESRISIFNHEAEILFGLEAKSVLGKRIAELSDVNGKCISAIFSTEQSELVMECSQHRTRIVSISLSNATGKDHSVESRTAIIKDLTETRRLEREILRNEKLTAMGELASGVAHEIRNPLNAITMIAQRYDREFVPQEDVEEYRSLTQVLKKESERLNGIVQQFLQFARPPKIKISEMRIDQFVSHVSTLFEGQAKQAGIQFLITCRYAEPIQIDPELMTQALLNILQNALHATQVGGIISLQIDKKENDLIVQVSDTGCGIPPDEIEKIFDLYFTTRSEGTGVGLAITQQIISQHRGSLHVESEVGKGTTVLIKLPLV